jgi:hypothetical protein
VGHLVQELSDLFRPSDQRRFWELSRVVEDLYHHYGHTNARLAETLYAPFDPDSETVPAPSVPQPDPVERLWDRLASLLEASNFLEASPERLLTERDREVLAKLKIDPDVRALEHVAVFHRGRGTKAVTIRPVRQLFRLQEVEVPTYRRVAVLVRTVAEPHVSLKLFKDVPCEDLELLLPTVRVRMKLFDKLKLSGSGGAAAVSAWKLLRALYTYTPSLAKILAVPFKIVLLPLVVVVGAIYGGKTFLDYSKIRASYVTALAENLYAITMASNRAVVSRLSSMAGEEDSKEVLIGFALLHHAGRQGLTPDELRARAEAFVWDRYRARVRFDVEDSLGKLEDLGLVRRLEGGRRRATPIDEALGQVDQVWDEVYVAPLTPHQRRRARVEGVTG